jgi:uncharacterized protein (DUF885 family)
MLAGEGMLQRLAAHDPLLSVAWGMPIERLPSLDPDWWSTRTALWREATGADDRLLVAAAQAEVEWMDHGEHLRCVHATLDSPLFAVRQCLDELPVATAADVALYTDVLASVPGALSGLEQTLRQGIAEQKTAARRQVIASVEAAQQWSVEALVERVPPKFRASLPAAEAADAFATIARFLVAEYMPHAHVEDGVGAEAYDVWARRYFLERPRHDWYEWAMDELDRVLDELRAARQAVDSAGPSFTVTGSAAHREWCEQFLAEATAATADLVPLPAGDGGPEVRLIPSCGIGSYAAYYSPPGGGSAGTVWIAPGDGPHYVEYEKVLVAHEGVPGHHAETVHQRQAGSLTPYQRVAYVPVHSEGWGLYAEELAEEAGLYDTPHSRAGYLGSLALRAASLVIDMGLHCGMRRRDGALWTVGSAGDLLVEVGLGEAAATAWIDNVLGRPGHRSTYAVGKLGWTEARRSAAAAGVNAGAFHVAALRRGPCTFETLRNLW